MNTRFALPVLVPGLLLAATALAGCSDDTTDKAAPPASNAATTPGSTSAGTSGAPQSKAASAGASGGGAGCPVTVAVLEKAFKASAEVSGAIVLGKGLKDVSCYEGWATAVTQPTNVDPAVVLFKYDTAKKAWAAQSGGTDNVCADAVPKNVATHLKGCQN